MRYSEAAKKLLFFRVAHGSYGHSKDVQVADFMTMSIRSTPNRIKDFFDNITGAEFSPRGKMVLTVKENSNTYELFRTSDFQRIPLPFSIAKVHLDSDDVVSIQLRNGSRLRWDVPEGNGNEVTYLWSRMLDSHNGRKEISRRRGAVLRPLATRDVPLSTPEIVSKTVSHEERTPPVAPPPSPGASAQSVSTSTGPSPLQPPAPGTLKSPVGRPTIKIGTLTSSSRSLQTLQHCAILRKEKLSLLAQAPSLLRPKICRARQARRGHSNSPLSGIYSVAVT